MTIWRRLSIVRIVSVMAVLLVLSWVSVALAQAESDGDGLDGDEHGLPILIGVGILVYIGWQAISGHSRKSR